jgi:hypothetical protein
MELTLGVRFQIVDIEEHEYHASFESQVSKIKNWVTQSRGSKTEAECDREALTPLWVELWVEKLQMSPGSVSNIQTSQEQSLIRKLEEPVRLFFIGIVAEPASESTDKPRSTSPTWESRDLLQRSYYHPSMCIYLALVEIVKLTLPSRQRMSHCKPARHEATEDARCSFRTNGQTAVQILPQRIHISYSLPVPGHSDV